MAFSHFFYCKSISLHLKRLSHTMERSKTEFTYFRDSAVTQSHMKNERSLLTGEVETEEEIFTHRFTSRMPVTAKGWIMPEPGTTSSMPPTQVAGMHGHPPPHPRMHEQGVGLEGRVQLLRLEPALQQGMTFHRAA